MQQAMIQGEAFIKALLVCLSRPGQVMVASRRVRILPYPDCRVFSLLSEVGSVRLTYTSAPLQSRPLVDFMQGVISNREFCSLCSCQP